MLKINQEEVEILTEEIKLVNAKDNGLIGYSPFIRIKFKKKGIDGYIQFYAGFYKEKDFEKIIHRMYKENPCDLDSRIDFIEIFDTTKFLDFIDSTMVLKFGNDLGGKIETMIMIDDEEIQLDYNGLLQIVE